MKINSRRVQAQPALTSYIEVEEGWGGLPAIILAESPIEHRGNDAEWRVRLFPFPRERHWAMIRRADKNRSLEHSLLIFFTLFPLLAFFLRSTFMWFHFAKFPTCPVQGLSIQEVPVSTTLIYHVQQEMIMENSSKWTMDSSIKGPGTSGIKV